MRCRYFVVIYAMVVIFISCSQESTVAESDQDRVFSDSQSEIDAIDNDIDHEQDTDVVVIDTETENADEDIYANDEDSDADNPKEYTINWGTDKDDVVTGAYLTKDGKTLYIMGYTSEDGLLSFPPSNQGFVLTVDMENYKQIASHEIASPWVFLFDEETDTAYFGEVETKGDDTICSIVSYNMNDWTVRWKKSFFKQQSENLSIYPSAFPALLFLGDLIVTGRDGDMPFIVRYTPDGEVVWRKDFSYFGSIEDCTVDAANVIYCVGYANPQSFYGGNIPDLFPIPIKPLLISFSPSGDVVYEKIFDSAPADGCYSQVTLVRDSLWFLYSTQPSCYLAVVDKNDGVLKHNYMLSQERIWCYIHQPMTEDPFGVPTIIRQEYTKDNGNDIFLSWHDESGKKIKEMRIKGNRDESYFFLFYYDNGETKKRYIVGSSNSDEFSYNGSNGDYDIFIIVTDLMR